MIKILSRLFAVLVMSFVVGGLNVAAASAGQNPTPSRGTAGGAAPAAIVPGTHECANFGSTNSAGFRAGHCVDVDEFTNSIGAPAVRGQGQAFCQAAATGQIVQCAGISQLVTITNRYTGATTSVNVTCGRYGGGACPTGRFQNLSPGVYASCNAGYVHYATVRTTIVLPSDPDTARSVNLNSKSAACFG